MKRAALVSVAVLLLAAMVVQAQPGWGGGGRDGRGRGDCPMMGDRPGDFGRRAGGPRFDGPGHLVMLKSELGLSDDQVSRLEKMAIDHRTEMVDQRASVEKAQIRLRALQRDNADAATVGKAIDDLGKVKADLQKKRYAHRQAMRSVLTAEQIKALDDLRLERRADRMDGRDKGPGRGWAPGWDADDDEPGEDDGN